MNSKKKTLILSLVLVCALAAAGFAYQRLSARSQQTLPSQGGSSSQSSSSSAPAAIAAPSFTLEDPEGTQLAFSDLLGEKPVVLNFWASTCYFCVQEMPDLQQAYEQYGSDISFVMLNVGDAMQGETREKADAYLEENGFTFPVYYDVDYNAVAAYGLRGFPATFFIDAQGNLVTYANGMLSAQNLQKGLAMIAPDLVPDAQ